MTDANDPTRTCSPVIVPFAAGGPGETRNTAVGVGVCQ